MSFGTHVMRALPGVHVTRFDVHVMSAVAAACAGRPGTVKRTTLRKKREIDDLLRTIITRDRASEALYRQCFPDRVLVEQFVRAQARSKVQAD